MNFKSDPKARLLLRLMHNLSEEYTCAQWFIDCEYALWADLTGERVDGVKPWGLSVEEREELGVLQKLSDGWFMWSDAERDYVFLTTNKWLEHLASRVTLSGK